MLPATYKGSWDDEDEVGTRFGCACGKCGNKSRKCGLPWEEHCERYKADRYYKHYCDTAIEDEPPSALQGDRKEDVTKELNATVTAEENYEGLTMTELKAKLDRRYIPKTIKLVEIQALKPGTHERIEYFLFDLPRKRIPKRIIKIASQMRVTKIRYYLQAKDHVFKELCVQGRLCVGRAALKLGIVSCLPRS